MCVVGALGSVLLLLPWVRFLWVKVGRVGWVVLRVGWLVGVVVVGWGGRVVEAKDEGRKG